MPPRFFIVVTLFAFVAGLAADAHADQLRYLDNGKDALAEVYQKFRDADSEVDLTYYIVDFCSPMMHVLFKGLADKIAAKKKEGKPFRVRLLADALTGNPDELRNAAAYLGEQGIEVRFFNAETAHSQPAANFRSHIKYSVVDGKTVITGGRNMAPDYFGLSSTFNWIDRDVAAEGPQAAVAKTDYEKQWNNTATFQAAPADPDALEKGKATCLAKWGDDENRLQAYLQANADRIVAATPVDTCNDVTFKADDFSIYPSGFLSLKDASAFRNVLHLTMKPSTEAIVGLLKDAKKHITLENYSYIPSFGVRAALAAKRRKIPVEVFTNNFRYTGEPVDWQSGTNAEADTADHQVNYQLSQYGSMDASWDLTPSSATFLIHSKVYATDGVNAAISSENIDPRSYHSNLESAMIVKNCPAFASRVEAHSEALRKFWDADETLGESCITDLSPTPSFMDRMYYRLIEQLL